MSRSLLFIVFISSLLLLAACAEKSQKNADMTAFRADAQLNAEQQQALITTVVRYAGRLPARATLQTRYESRFDADYAETAAEFRLELFHQSEDGRMYLVISRDARSLHSRRVATGIELIPGTTAGERPEFYFEHFRTWAMAPDELDRKAGELFLLMKAGADLTPFWPEHSGDEEYIEFPNTEVYFDADTRSWVRHTEHPLQTLQNLRNQL